MHPSASAVKKASSASPRLRGEKCRFDKPAPCPIAGVANRPDFGDYPSISALVAVQNDMSFYDKLKFDANGLVPAIIQDQKTGRVLMMAWMNRASIEKTFQTGKTHFWSRSKQRFWMKGESSGHVQSVKDVAFDCDGDTLLIQVEQVGAACHDGYRSCFYRSVAADKSGFSITEERLVNPDEVYAKK